MARVDDGEVSARAAKIRLARFSKMRLKKGYSEQDITKILGGNLLRVMQQVEAASGR